MHIGIKGCFKKLFPLVIMFHVFLPITFSQPPHSKDDLQKQRQALLKEIEDVKEQLGEAHKNKIQSLGVVKGIEKKINIRGEIIRNIKGEVWLVEKDMIRTFRDIDTLKKELLAVKVQFAQSIIYAYKNRSSFDFLNFLFSSDNFKDALIRVAYLKTYRDFRTKKAEDIAKLENQLKAKVGSLKGKREDKAKALDLEKVQINELEKEKHEKNRIVSQFASQEGKLQKSLQNRQKEQKQIQNAISLIIKREKEEILRKEREEKKKADDLAKANAKNNSKNNTGKEVEVVRPKTPKTKSSSVLESTPEGLIISQQFEDNKGNLPWPVDKCLVTLRFGNNKVENIDIPSDGITMETSIGNPVKAIFSGTVSFIFPVGNYFVITLRHGKYFTTYSNLQTVSVSKGQEIKTGQTLGKANSNDYGIGEVGLQIDTERGPLNPEQWLRTR